MAQADVVAVVAQGQGVESWRLGSRNSEKAFQNDNFQTENDLVDTTSLVPNLLPRVAKGPIANQGTLLFRDFDFSMEVIHLASAIECQR